MLNRKNSHVKRLIRHSEVRQTVNILRDSRVVIPSPSFGLPLFVPSHLSSISGIFFAWSWSRVKMIAASKPKGYGAISLVSIGGLKK